MRGGLLDGDGFGEVSWLVYIAAAADGYVISQELEGDDLDERREDFDGRGDADGVLDEAGDGGVAFGGDGDYAAGASRDFLDVGEGFLVAEF